VTDNILDAAPPASEAPCSPAEWDARVDLAMAYRLLDWLGLTDLIHTHISVVVPGEPTHFLQLPYGHLFGEARASQMVKCDLDGNILSDPSGLGISRGGFAIHSAIHLGAPAAACVMHAHTEATIAVANYRAGLLPLSQHALRFFGKIAYLDYSGVFDSAAQRGELPRVLGAGDVLMLRNHGPLVVGATIAEAFSRIYYLERACRIQVASLSQCRDPSAELTMPDEAHCHAMARAFEGGERIIAREWTALRRMLDRNGADYAA